MDNFQRITKGNNYNSIDSLTLQNMRRFLILIIKICRKNHFSRTTKGNNPNIINQDMQEKNNSFQDL